MRQAMFVIRAITLSVHAEQMNVKLLTGLTETELQRSMNLMRS